MATDPNDWTKYDDVEVMSRLLRRGVEPIAAKALVRDRRLPEAAEDIEDVLGREFLDADDKPIRFETPIDRRPRR